MKQILKLGFKLKTTYTNALLFEMESNFIDKPIELYTDLGCSFIAILNLPIEHKIPRNKNGSITYEIIVNYLSSHLMDSLISINTLDNEIKNYKKK